MEDNEVYRKQRRYKEQHPDSYNSYAEREYTRPAQPKNMRPAKPKNRKPAIELPNPSPKRNWGYRDEVKVGKGKGARAIYRNFSKDYWTGV